MIRVRAKQLALLAIVLASVMPGTAAAQSALESTTGGIRLGDAMVLHLGIGAEFAWDSNVFYESSKETSAFEMRLTPGFLLTNRPRGQRRTIEFDFHGDMNYLEYLTSDSSLAALRQFGVDAGVVAGFFTQSPYNFVLFENYSRTTEPPYTKTTYNLDRDVNEVGTRVNLSPGGGRLTFNVGYRFGLDYFEVSQLQDFDLLYHIFDLRASWRFLPKTALYIAATEGLYFYQHPGIYMHPNSYPLRVDAGIQGLITTKLTVNAWVGYGNGFYVSGPSPNTAVGGLTLTWKPTSLSTGVVGYQHDFQNSLLGSYYDLDQAYLSWAQQVWRFVGLLRLGYANQRYAGIIIPGPSAEQNVNRTDNLVTLNVRVDYHIKDWMFASAGYDFAVNRSNGMLNLGIAGIVPVNYTKHVVYLRLTFAY